MKNLLLAAVLVGGLAFQPVQAHDLHEFGEWSESLKQPDNSPAPCCGESDAFWVDRYEASASPTNQGGFRALVRGAWIEILAKKVIWDRVNPTGRGVVFLNVKNEFSKETDLGSAYVYCFVPGSGV